MYKLLLVALYRVKSESPLGFKILRYLAAILGIAFIIVNFLVGIKLMSLGIYETAFFAVKGPVISLLSAVFGFSFLGTTDIEAVRTQVNNKIEDDSYIQD